jgi:drug/metabolite transporter (DMT)-like permease
MAGMLVTGTCNTMIMKVQDNTYSPNSPIYHCNVFQHPYLQTAMMFVGELLCFAFLYIKRAIYGHENKKILECTTDAVMLSPGMQRAVEQKKLVKINPIWLSIPAACDFMSSTMMFIALTMVPGSVYQIMRGMIVVITAFFSVWFLGRKLYRHNWASIIVIVLGVAQVGWVAMWQIYAVPSTN